jgi:ABC-type Fe3+ transport system permease subunit
MIRKIIFVLIWFIVIFIISYSIGGYIYIKTTGIAMSGGFQAGLEAGRAVRDAYQEAYLIYLLIGSLILACLGTATSILPGTKKKPRAKKKASAKKKGRKKK